MFLAPAFSLSCVFELDLDKTDPVHFLELPWKHDRDPRKVLHRSLPSQLGVSGSEVSQACFALGDPGRNPPVFHYVLGLWLRPLQLGLFSCRR